MKRSKDRLSVILSLLIAASMILMPTQSALAYWVGGSDYGPVHENIVQYAMNIYQGSEPNPELLNYLETIKHGAWHEDQIDHVDDEFGIFGACLTQSHFWDGDKGPNDPVDNVYVCGSVINSWQKAQILWGMALGEYRSGDKAAAYEYLGHVAHLLADQSVPTHAHEDAHPPPGGDIYEDWMTSTVGQLSSGEMLMLELEGPVEIPLLPADKSYGQYGYNDPIGPLYYLFYTMNQIGDYFPSDDYGGDNGWNATYGDWIGDVYTDLNLPPVHGDDLDDGDDNGAVIQDIRFYSYFYTIRATAALFDLFWQEAASHAALTVVIDQVLELEDHEDNLIGDYVDYFVKVSINGFQYRNEGDQIEEQTHIYPGWAFGRNVGITGDIPIVIQLFDEDDDPDADDPSAIDPVEGRRDLDLFVNLDTGEIREQESGAVLGYCGDTLVSEGHENDDDRSRIWYRILLPNIPPTADAGDDQTVDEGDLVELNGTFTDPNEEDTHTFLWHLESSTNGQAVADSTSESLSFTPNDNGVYTFSFTVTDNFGASGSDEVVVTSLNVPPEASIDSLTDELGAEIGVDVPVALVGLEVDLAGSFTDAGTADTHTAEIHWGDGIIDPETAFNHFVDCTGGLILGFLHDTHIYAVPGSFTIILNVTDDDGGVSTQTIPIEIVDAAGAIEYVIESLTENADHPNIQAALDKLQGEQDGDASNGALDMLEQGNLNAALEKIKQALEYMEAAEAADPTLDLTYDKGLLALAAKSVAVGAIAEKESVAYKQNDLLKIQDAKILVAEGDVLLGALDYVSAVGKYQEAVRKVP